MVIDTEGQEGNQQKQTCYLLVKKFSNGECSSQTLESTLLTQVTVKRKELLL